MRWNLNISLATVGYIILFRDKDILVFHLEIHLLMEDEWWIHPFLAKKGEVSKGNS